MISPGASGSTVMTGIHIYMGGIGLQELCILVFTSIAIKFSLLMRRNERELASSRYQILDETPKNWRMLLYVLYASLTLITTRIIFRLVEFASGIDPIKNPIPYHDAYFMALDALPMFVAIALMNVVHPGRILQGQKSEFLKGPTRKEKKEARRIRKEQKKSEKQEKKALREERKVGQKAGWVDNVYVRCKGRCLAREHIEGAATYRQTGSCMITEHEKFRMNSSGHFPDLSSLFILGAALFVFGLQDLIISLVQGMWRMRKR